MIVAILLWKGLVALWTEEDVWIDHLLFTLVSLADTGVSAVKADDCHRVGFISEERLKWNWLRRRTVRLLVHRHA